MLSNLDRSLTTPKEHTRNIWNSYVDWWIRNPVAHAAIRQIGVSEKLSAETELAVKEMFPELHELCRRSVRRCLCPMSLKPLAMRFSYRLPNPQWNLPPAILPAPSISKRSGLRLCGVGLPRESDGQ